MQQVIFEGLRLFESSREAERRASERALAQLVQALMYVNMAWLLAHPRTPLLYQAGIRYQAEPRGTEHFQSIPKVLARRRGDCEDLSAYRVAELRVRAGEPARLRLTYRRIGGHYRYHVTVRRADGRVEDPSLRLGMRRGA